MSAMSYTVSEASDCVLHRDALGTPAIVGRPLIDSAIMQPVRKAMKVSCPDGRTIPPGETCERLADIYSV